MMNGRMRNENRKTKYVTKQGNIQQKYNRSRNNVQQEEQKNKFNLMKIRETNNKYTTGTRDEQIAEVLTTRNKYAV